MQTARLTHVLLAHSEPVVSSGIADTLRQVVEVSVALPPVGGLATRLWLDGPWLSADVAICDYETGMESARQGMHQKTSLRPRSPAILLVTHHRSEGEV